MRAKSIDEAQVEQLVIDAGPMGIASDALEAKLAHVSRSTVGRRLRALVSAGRLVVRGKGPATRYVPAAAYSEVAIRDYFQADWQLRPYAPFCEQFLGGEPALTRERADRLSSLSASMRALDKKFLADFLIDFSWASSLLEGSTYSAIDTQALIEYGQRNPEKPVEDALLILNHKNAIEYLWSHREISTEVLCELQSRLTDDHGLPEAQDSDHFLPIRQRGVPREYEEVRLGRSAYSPPFRPGTGYVARMLTSIVDAARTQHPLSAAFYLLTRIPYLQAFANGNKRTARLAANLPLLGAGLPPLSFVDFDKAEYVLGMSAFYELGDIQVIERSFIQGYVRSIIRAADLPVSARVNGLNLKQVVAELVKYVYSGRRTESADALLFLRAPLSPRRIK